VLPITIIEEPMKICPMCSGKVQSRGLSAGRNRYYCLNCRKNFYEEEEDYKNEVTKKEENGILEIEAKTKDIKTLEGLIKYCEIDLNEWVIEKHTINKWGIVLKINNIPTREMIFQVKAWLYKKKPTKQIFPTIQSVEIKVSPFKTKTTKTKIQKAAVFGDAHVGYERDVFTNNLNPFNDRKAMSVSLKILDKEKPDTIVILVDMLDFAELSDKFIKRPEFYWTIQPAIIELGWYLGKIRTVCPTSRIVYLGSNHSKRLENYIINHFIAAYNLRAIDELEGVPVLSEENLLNFKSLNIESLNKYPEGEFWINNKLKVTHGTVTRSVSGETVKSLVANTHCSQIIGHIHRQELASKTFEAKETEIFQVFSPGTLARIDGIVPSRKGKDNWQQGISFVEYTEDYFNILPISITNGKAIFNGILYEGEEYKEALRKDTKWNF